MTIKPPQRIMMQGDSYYGTLGCTVLDADTHEPLALSNHHVMVAGKTSKTVEVTDSKWQRTPFATVIRANKDLDCAVVSATSHGCADGSPISSRHGPYPTSGSATTSSSGKAPR